MPLLNIINAFPMPLTLNLETSSGCSASFVSSSQSFTKHLNLAEDSTTSVVMVFQPESEPTFNFQYMLVYFHESASQTVIDSPPCVSLL